VREEAVRNDDDDLGVLESLAAWRNMTGKRATKTTPARFSSYTP
jgi:hypothetical protein